MDRDDLIERVRTLRANGVAPKAIARAVGLRPADVAPLIRAVAEQGDAAPAVRDVVGCWVSTGWSHGLGVDGPPEWPRSDVELPQNGLATVLVARDDRPGRVRVCGFLVDVYCLGVKNAVGPKRMDRSELPGFVDDYYAVHGAPIAAPLELAQHLVLGAVEYARGLGFEPHRDFAAAARLLGPWSGPSKITFGRAGKPVFIQGPYDDGPRVMETLERTVGAGNYEFLVAV